YRFPAIGMPWARVGWDSATCTVVWPIGPAADGSSATLGSAGETVARGTGGPAPIVLGLTASVSADQAVAGGPAMIMPASRGARLSSADIGISPRVNVVEWDLSWMFIGVPEFVRPGHRLRRRHHQNSAVLWAPPHAPASALRDAVAWTRWASSHAEASTSRL